MKNVAKKISMKDIAQELAISITTVSFVINGKSEKMGISPATTKRVKDLIKKRGFNPNSAARILRTGKSKTIGLIVEDVGNYFFGNIAKVIEIIAHKNGYNVFYSSTENNNNTAIELITKMKNSSVDGFIITATKGLQEEIKKLTLENIPFVLFDRLVPGTDTHYVILDNYKGAFDLTKHLLGNGYKNIGFISIMDDMSQMIDRKKGFIDALAEAKINISAKSFLEITFEETERNAISAIEKFLKKNTNLDALFFGTNYLGVYGLEAIQNCGLQIPSDLAVVSFDDNDLFRLTTPSITVSAQPIEEMASQSIELLLKLINKEQKNVSLVRKIIKPKLIIRNSSLPRKENASQKKLPNELRYAS